MKRIIQIFAMSNHFRREGILVSCFRNFVNHRNLLEFISRNLLESVRVTLQFD